MLLLLWLSQPNSCIDFDSRPTHGDWVGLCGFFLLVNAVGGLIYLFDGLY